MAMQYLKEGYNTVKGTLNSVKTASMLGIGGLALLAGCSGNQEAIPIPTATSISIPTSTPNPLAINDLFEELESSTSEVRKYSGTVVSTQPWTPTGITVGPNDVISIKALGYVIYANPPEHAITEPDGTNNPPGGCNYVVMDESVNAQALIGNVSDEPELDGKGFQVGSDLERVVVSELHAQGKTTKDSGTLFLGFNDGGVYCDRSDFDDYAFGGDNRGDFQVQITVTKP